MSKVFIEENSLTAIGNAIREKTGGSGLLTVPTGMVEAIGSIQSGGGGDLPEEAFTITGDCVYRFSNNNWNWFVENYGDRITTNNIANTNSMFYYSSSLETIPFDINFSGSSNDINYMFYQCNNLKELPSMNFVQPNNLSYLFQRCDQIREIPDDYFDNWDFSYLDNLTNSYSGSSSSIFTSCYSLRKLPMSILEHGNPVVVYYSTIYYYMAHQCYCLDEIVDLPNPHKNATWTSNAFSNTFQYCNRIKNLTFKADIGSVNWKSQTLDLSKNVGYAGYTSYITGYNSGITEATRITDDATYQALKDDPDSWTTDINYSRYNHDSAVATINSLPDTSAYLASAGGTNTILFKGASGALTDGGAINTLTEEEIAVATAKGWTVSLV